MGPQPPQGPPGGQSPGQPYPGQPNPGQPYPGQQQYPGQPGPYGPTQPTQPVGQPTGPGQAQYPGQSGPYGQPPYGQPTQGGSGGSGGYGGSGQYGGSQPPWMEQPDEPGGGKRILAIVGAVVAVLAVVGAVLYFSGTFGGGSDAPSNVAEESKTEQQGDKATDTDTSDDSASGSEGSDSNKGSDSNNGESESADDSTEPESSTGGEAPAAGAPEDAVKAYFTAFQEGDCEAAFDLMYIPEELQAGEDAAKQSMCSSMESMPDMGPAGGELETKVVKGAGTDRVTVKVGPAGYVDEAGFDLEAVNVDGEWKVDFSSMATGGN